MITTPLRAADHQVREGVRMLQPDMDIAYRDGAEDRLLEIVGAATDLRSDATELLAAAEGWAEQYHAHPARANILRAVEIPTGARILEIGAGTGPITRYLGETGATVDAVEPAYPRAQVARARTRDLPGVEVFCGLVEDVPAEPAYDLVVVVGVLEYVAAGGADPEPYLDFLRACRARLRPGGALVLAIENKLGVKYLTGTGEDHSGRMFDGIEDYPRGGPARTFSATALLDLVRTAGFDPRLFGVFPDYKHTRVVFDADALGAVAPGLLVDLPSFPSRFAGTRSLRLASEKRVWQELVRDGLAAHFPNSFLVLGGTGTGEAADADLWPESRLARYFSINRSRPCGAVTTLDRVEDTVRFTRVYGPDPGPLVAAGDTAWDYVGGDGFLEVFAAAERPAREDLLRRWIALVGVRAAAAPDGLVPLDAIPTNVVITPDGELRLIDSEYHGPGTVDHVIERGLFWLAVHLGATTPPEVWEPAKTVGALFEQLRGWAGRDADPDVWARFVAVEAPFQVAVTCLYPEDPADPDAPVAAATTALERQRDQRLWETPLGRRLHHDHDDAVAARERLELRRSELAATRDELRAKLRTAREERSELKADVAAQRNELKQLRRAAKDAQADAAAERQTLARLQRHPLHRIPAAVARRLRRLRPGARSRTGP